MYIYLVDHSTERGQRRVLIEELYINYLQSYAFVKQKGFDDIIKYWEELLRIHLADTTAKLNGDVNIKTILSDENKPEHLFSYAYQNHENQWSDSWNQTIEKNKNMNIHLAGLPSQNNEIQSQGGLEIESHLTTFSDKKEIESKEKIWHDMNIHLAGHTADINMDKKTKPLHDNHLTTYSDQKEVEDTLSVLDKVSDLRPRVIIDSGAFTAYTTGKTINPRDYASWSLDFQKRWEYKMKSLEFMNLDVIGNQDDSWKNQSILESLGMTPIPIITFGADKKHLIRALDNYDYIALGGLVPYSRNKPKLQKWLDYCFNIITRKYKETGVMPKIHLLGITTDWVLKRYPCYSSDSSSWVSCLRFGGASAAGLDKIPRYKESDAAMSATIHTLRSEIRKYKKMEEESTNLWKSRGIIWDD